MANFPQPVRNKQFSPQGRINSFTHKNNKNQFDPIFSIILRLYVLNTHPLNIFQISRVFFHESIVISRYLHTDNIFIFSFIPAHFLVHLE